MSKNLTSLTTFKWMTALSNEIEPASDDQQEVKRLKLENASLKEKLYAATGDICPETFKEDDKVKHYTGLCYKTLLTLFTYLEPNITHTSRSSLTKFQKLVLLLMKLRLNLGIRDLGYRFNVSPSCVSKIFLDMIRIMYVRMKCLILWPDRRASDVYANGISQVLWC